MSGFDTTDVAAKVDAQPFDALKTMGDLAQINNLQNQNKLFQAKNLAGQYIAASTNPDGTIDNDRLNKFFRHDPRIGPEVLASLTGAKNIQNVQTGIENTQLGMANTQLATIRKFAATAAQAAAIENKKNPKGPQRNPKDAAISAIAGLDPRIAPREMAEDFLGSPDFTNTVDSAILSGDTGAMSQEAAYGKIGSVSTPQGTQFVNTNVVDNTVDKPGGNSSFIKNQISPADLASPIDVVDPATGVKHRSILGDYIDQETGTWKAGKTPPLIDAGALNNSARATLGAAYAPQIANFENEVGAAPQTKTLIEQIRSLGSQFDTGPNSDFWRKMGEFASEYGIKIGDNDLKVGASEAFSKILPSLIRHQAAMLGMNETDSGRQVAAASVPTTYQTPEGRDKMLAILEGNVDAIAAKGQVWRQEKDETGPGSWGNFNMDFSRKIPPSIFQSQYMSPAEIKDLQKGWTPQQKTKWENARELAKKQGWLPNVK